MRIGIYCNEYPPSPHGGIGSVTEVLARSLAARGHSVWVGGMYPGEVKPEMQRQYDRGVEVARIPYRRGRYTWIKARYQFYSLVRRMMREQQLDVIEVPDWEGFAAGWGKLPGPVVVRLHGSATYFAREMGRSVSHAHRFLESSSFRRADYCCSTSRYTAEKTARLFSERHRDPAVLFNPVDVEESDPVERDRNRIVFAGTLTPKKGVISLARAWPAVVRAVPSAELHLFGKDAGGYDGGPLFPFLVGQLDPAVRKSLVWHGPVRRQQVKEEFRKARAAIFPSYSEAFGVVPMEAMAERCPVIYTQRSSGPELITDGADGLLIDPDDHDAISRSLVRLLQDNALASALGEAGYQRVKSSFSTEALTPRNEAFFEESIHDFRRERSR